MHHTHFAWWQVPGAVLATTALGFACLVSDAPEIGVTLVVMLSLALSMLYAVKRGRNRTMRIVLVTMVRSILRVLIPVRRWTRALMAWIKAAWWSLKRLTGVPARILTWLGDLRDPRRKKVRQLAHDPVANQPLPRSVMEQPSRARRI